MLPTSMHQDDTQYIRQQLAKIPYSYRARACQGYSKAWQEAYEAEPELRHKENKARNTANTRLREYVDKVLAR